MIIELRVTDGEFCMSLFCDVFVSIIQGILFCNLVCVCIYKICEEQCGGCMLLVIVKSEKNKIARYGGTDFAA